ncbi:MAG: D-sedoheptulose 7-phosphate isomerase [Candidatus Nanopelagicales bacterium]|nr:D-sedoheptulose 7-phosphate isomerase [Candidatus Nanopelagicales bacterium]
MSLVTESQAARPETDVDVEVLFREHAEVFEDSRKHLSEGIAEGARLIVESLSSGGTIFWCGNGGSAADSQHLAAELVGRFKKNRHPLRSVALTTDSSTLTCIANDFGYEHVFERQVEGLGRPGDVLVAISTSGQSENIRLAVQKANAMGMTTIALLGKSGGNCQGLADVELIVPSDTTARIQEVHIFIGHTLCELAEIGLGLA